MKIPVLNGTYIDNTGEPRTAYPRNLIPVPKDTGISKGYLRPGEGLVNFATGPGVDRGGINWNDDLYRVMGSKLVYVGQSGGITIIGDVGNDGLPVAFTYSFTQLAVLSNGNLFYYDGATFQQVTDINLGKNFDLIWVDGYFLLTDGNTLVVTNLADPTTVNPLKYGSAEADPGVINCLLKLRNTPYAVKRYIIEAFQDTGGTLFPFQRIDGAEVMRGSVGRKTACIFLEQLAFLGSAKNEPCAVYLAVNGVSTKVSTREIDAIIQSYPENSLSQSKLEARIDKSNAFLYIHLTDRTLVYDFNASQATQEAVWFTLDSGLRSFSAYRVRNLVWCYNQWVFGDPSSSALGTFAEAVSTHYANEIGWEFLTTIIFNDGNGVIVHELELIASTGYVNNALTPTIWTSYSTDGVTWSIERPRSAAKIGNRQARLNWLQCGNMRNFRIQKFRGTSSAYLNILALEARIEPLND